MSKGNKLTPELRFPEFRNDGKWEKLALGELSDIVKGEQLNRIELTEMGKYPCQNGGINPSGYTDKFNAEENTITISEGGNSCGYVNFMTSKFWLGGHCYKLLNRKNINKLFLYQILKFNEDSIMKLRLGSGLPNIQLKAIRDFEIEICNSEHEQQKIASCLSFLDEIITAHSKKLELFKDHKKGLMQDLFPQEGETVPNIRFSEFNESWKKVKLKDVSLYFNGGSYENDVKEEGKYELITLKSINTSGKLVNSKRYVDIEVPTLAKGTLVMILSEQAPGLLGMTAIIPTDNKYVLNQRVAEIRPNQKVEGYFLSMAINRNQKYFSKQGAGTKVQNISKPNVENYDFLLPEILEQQKIASCLSALEELITAQTEKIEQLKLHKKGLMQSLFSKMND